MTEQSVTHLDLSTRLANAIDNENLDELNKLVIICDFLHKGIQRYEYDNDVYTIKDIPSDTKYEEAKRVIERLQSIDLAVLLPKILDKKITKIDNTNKTIMFMDGIQITTDIPAIENALLMPKFDGCSVAIELLRYNDTWIVNRAHTRGSDDLSGNRRCQDKTELLQKSFDLSKFNTIFESLSKNNESYRLRYKDITKIGNNNDILETEIKFKDISKICIRGEFVAKDKDNDLDITPVGISAGCLNSIDFKYIDYIEYIPFEITKIYTTIINEESINEDSRIKEDEFIPTQEDAIKILRLFKLISYPVIKVTRINSKTNMESILKKYENRIRNPLDGVVYCNNLWTYPNCEEETSKRINYGKYKWKRSNIRQTRLSNIIYSIGKTGSITPSFIFDVVEINNKKYTKAKTSFKQIEEFQKTTTLHRGTICDLELKSDISPYICKVYDTCETEKINENDIFKKLTNCPCCNSLLKYDRKKDSLTATCTNDICKAVLLEKCADFLKQIGYKGISITTLSNIFSNINYDFDILYNDKLIEKDSDKVVGKKTKTIYSTESMKQRLQKENRTKFDELITNIESDRFLICLSLYTKAQVSKLKYSKEKNTNMIETLKSNTDYRELLTNRGFFVDNLISFIENRYF